MTIRKRKLVPLMTLCSVMLTCGTSVTAQSSSVKPVLTGTYELVQVGRYSSGIFNKGAAEIVAFDKLTRRVFVINAESVTIDVLDITDPSKIHKVGAIDMASVGNVANSVAVGAGIVAVAVEADNKQDRGSVAFFDSTTLALIGVKKVGALPDAVTFSSDYRYVLVANEGEPSDDYSVDPEGSVSIIDLIGGVDAATVAHATFEQYNDQLLSLRRRGVRVFGPGASVAQDFEPEFIAATKDGTAYVTLQENNALALVDIATATVKSVVALGFKDYSLPANKLDVSDADGGIVLKNWPVYGMYQPDAIASYHVDGQSYLVTANEGDSRDYEGYSEEQRVATLELDEMAFPNATALQQEQELGRLKVTSALGDIDGDGDIDQIHAFGARSFSIWNEACELVFDSGSDFERLTAKLLPEHFNSDDETPNSFDLRSDDKGPEPEGVVVGTIGDRHLAFIGLERISGVMVYDVTNPADPVFQSYLNTRGFNADLVDTMKGSNVEAGDIGPEGMVFIAAKDSPTGQSLLVVGNEVSGTTVVFEFHRVWTRSSVVEDAVQIGQ